MCVWGRAQAMVRKGARSVTRLDDLHLMTSCGLSNFQGLTESSSCLCWHCPPNPTQAVTGATVQLHTEDMAAALSNLAVELHSLCVRGTAAGP